jgi:hypothetical protein
MAAASPSVFLLMVNGQVESAQVSDRLLCRVTLQFSPGSLPSTPRAAAKPLQSRTIPSN